MPPVFGLPDSSVKLTTPQIVAERRMKKIHGIVVLVVLLSALISGVQASEASAEEPVPALTLPLPESLVHREYLGLEGISGKTFTLADIKTDILLIELFSMYCPYCQAEAPLVNTFYELARQQSKRGPVVKVIGLGASNSRFEVEHFRKTYDIAFPLFPDEDLSMYEQFGGEGTPGFIGCRYEHGKEPVIVLRQWGGFDTAEAFMDLLLEHADKQ